MNLDLERFLDSIGFTGRLALDGSVQRYGHKGNQWVWSLERDGNAFVVGGDWSTGEKTQFGKRTLGIRQALREMRNSDATKHASAARMAQDLWPLLDTKPTGRTYLERKGVAGYGVRYSKQLLFVPMVRGVEMVGMQRITPAGEKRFTAGCAKRGASHRIPGHGQAVLCEGYATGASIHMATRRPVVIAFDCGNLKPAAEWHDDIGFVAADNDLTEGNPGVLHATSAAAAADAQLVVAPPGMDWNDVHQSQGLAAVRLAFP